VSRSTILVVLTGLFFGGTILTGQSDAFNSRWGVAGEPAAPFTFTPLAASPRWAVLLLFLTDMLDLSFQIRMHSRPMALRCTRAYSKEYYITQFQ
jgi:hypothetical protein